MKICLVIHKNEKRIKVEFPNTKESAQRIRQIADARWSATLKSWHIPYTKEAFEQLKNPDLMERLEVLIKEKVKGDAEVLLDREEPNVEDDGDDD